MIQAQYHNTSVLYHTKNKLTVYYLKTSKSNTVNLNNTHGVTKKLCEQGLITKECIAMHTNFNF